MNKVLDGKVAIVTGASKGIGAGIAKRMGEAGAKVIVNYASDEAAADQVVAKIIAGGGQATAVKGSVAIAKDVKNLFEIAKNTYGTIDILVNNAGVFKFSPIDAISEEDFYYQFNTNVLGTIFTTQQALNYFPETGGSIINISSGASVNPWPQSSVYSASKAAVDTLTKAFARELGGRKIRINTVAPGATETEGAHNAGFLGGEMEKHAVSLTPLGRIGQPEDIAKVVIFLASEAADWITGDRINASGGWV